MAVYNFTVRATDNLLNFADRAFSIEVLNTVADNFIALGSTGSGRSIDGVTWNLIPGLSGEYVRYMDDRWVIHRRTVDATLSTSQNGIDWVTFTPVLPSGVSRLVSIKFRKGAWYAIGLSPTPIGAQYLVTSVDKGVTWTIVGTSIASLPSPDTAHYGDFEYDAASNTWVAIINGTIAANSFARYSLNDGATWNSCLPSSLSNDLVAITANVPNSRIYRINGSWLIKRPSITASNAFRVSTDGINWSTISISGAVSADIVASAWFNNGYIEAFAYQGFSAVECYYSNNRFISTIAVAPGVTSFSSANVAPFSIEKGAIHNGVRVFIGAIANRIAYIPASFFPITSVSATTITPASLLPAGTLRGIASRSTP